MSTVDARHTPSADEGMAADIPSLPDLLSIPSATLAKPEFAAYLALLTDLPLSELESEPTTLSSSSAQLTNALTTLCHTSYPTFLSLHSTTSTLSSSLSSLSSSLDSLLSALPALETSARSFAQETREIQKDRRKASLVLEQHDKLYDVLSLPALLDSCVRSHSYNDALLLSQHANALVARFPTNPLVQSVQADCAARVHAMLAQLLGTLREPAKLPALFRAVSFLRKMAVLPEPELALAFLTGRAAHLDGALRATELERRGADADKETQARFLKKYADVWREGVYDVVTQFATIFLERGAAENPPESLLVLLRVFTTQYVDDLLALLRETLPHIPDPSLLNSLLTQLTYCANSFARVGMDFKPLLAPVFVDAVRAAVTKELDDAAQGWAVKLSVAKDKAKSTAVKRPAQVVIAASALASPPHPTPAQLESLKAGVAHSPPQILVSYPPLALYTNSVLTALNGLRLLAPVELYADLLRALQTSLVTSASALLRYVKEKPWTSGSKSSSAEQDEEDQRALRGLGAVFFQVFVPFVLRAFSEGVYGRVLADVESQELVEVREQWEELVGSFES